MDGPKILEVVELYRQEFARRNFGKARHPPEDEIHSIVAGLRHCHWMLDGIETFVKEGRLQKAFRWLGFIQGALWGLGLCTIEELKNHNKPESKETAGKTNSD